MPNFELDLTPLKNALKTLEEALVTSTTDANLLLRDGAIQRFEYTFELSWKLMQRFLKFDNNPEAEPSYGKRDMFRQLAKQGLISDPQPWFEFLEMRNLTTHAYDEEKANLVFATIKKFPPFVHDFLNHVESIQH